jgi:hypothetical protein
MKRERKIENGGPSLLIGVSWLQASMRRREVDLLSLERKEGGREGGWPERIALENSCFPKPMEPPRGVSA